MPRVQRAALLIVFSSFFSRFGRPAIEAGLKRQSKVGYFRLMAQIPLPTPETPTFSPIAQFFPFGGG